MSAFLPPQDEEETTTSTRLDVINDHTDDDVDDDDDDDEIEEENDDEDDLFDINDVSVPRLSSSTMPIIVEVSNSNKVSRFYSNPDDPLFHGVCLYSTSSSNTNQKSHNHNTNNGTNDHLTKATGVNIDDTEKLQKAATSSWDATSWFLPSIFGRLWLHPQERRR
jgi:hypothetical protein